MDSDSRHSISVHVSCHIKPPSLVPTSILSICFNLTTPSDPSHFSEVVATLASSPHSSDFSICPLCILSTHPIRLLPAARLGGEPPPSTTCQQLRLCSPLHHFSPCLPSQNLARTKPISYAVFTSAMLRLFPWLSLCPLHSSFPPYHSCKLLYANLCNLSSRQLASEQKLDSLSSLDLLCIPRPSFGGEP